MFPTSSEIIQAHLKKAAIYRVSQAAGPVADYIKALIQLGETYDKIRPYEDQLAVKLYHSGSR
jgi:hypothetical protein